MSWVGSCSFIACGIATMAENGSPHGSFPLEATPHPILGNRIDYTIKIWMTPPKRSSVRFSLSSPSRIVDRSHLTPCSHSMVILLVSEVRSSDLCLSLAFSSLKRSEVSPFILWRVPCRTRDYVCTAQAVRKRSDPPWLDFSPERPSVKADPLFSTPRI